MTRGESALQTAKIDFNSARDEGLARIEEILDFYQPRLGLPRNELRVYLQENISFYLDDEMRAGLDLYYRLAQKHGLLATVKPLKSLNV